jgi:hypothetical protein
MESDETSTIELERRLAAIMFTDIVGFSQQMGVDEARMLPLLEIHNQIVHHKEPGTAWGLIPAYIPPP